jgi:D-alanyl-D-alanine carboxypeptidase
MDLMYGLMLPSGNDSAVALAELVGELIHSGYGHSFGYVNSFVNEMNRFAKHMGLKSTYYTNPHGLRPGNKSTVRDISLLGSYLMSEPELEEI